MQSGVEKARKSRNDARERGNYAARALTCPRIITRFAGSGLPVPQLQIEFRPSQWAGERKVILKDFDTRSASERLALRAKA
jgi:hypothetical protein